VAKDVEFFETDSGKMPFLEWYENIAAPAQYKVNALVDKAKLGIGSVESITGSSGLFEIRDLTKGPGFRVYFGNDGTKIILLLIGGDKSTQKSDIKSAKELWEQHQKRKSKRKKEEKISKNVEMKTRKHRR